MKSSCQFSSLTLKSFCDVDKPRSAYPKLKGKGAEIKDLVEPLLMAFDKFRRVGHVDDDRVHASLREQVALQAIFAETSGDPFLPPR